MQGLRFSLMTLLIVILLLFLQYRLWFDQGGVKEMTSLKKTLAQQKLEIENLQKRNAVLLFQIQRLQKSDDITEARARNELGMIKKGEVFYQVVK